MQGLIQKEKVDIDGDKSAQIGISAKKIVTKMTPDYGYGARTSCALQLFCFFVIMFICYWHDKKTGIDIYW